MLAVLAVFLVYLAAVPVSVAVVAEGGVRVGASIFLPGAAVRSARPISGKPKKKKRTDLPLTVRAIPARNRSRYSRAELLRAIPAGRHWRSSSPARI